MNQFTLKRWYRDRRVTAFLACIVAFLGYAHAIPSLRAQEEDPPPVPPLVTSSVTIDYGSETIQPIKHDSTFANIPLNPGQAVTITVQFDLALSGQTVVADSLDGGQLTVGEQGLVIDQNGILTFQYQADTNPGLCRILLHQLGDGDTIQFWVIDTAHPGDNPPDLDGN